MDVIKKGNKLTDWHIVKFSKCGKYFDMYLSSNNGKRICCIISPTCKYYPLWHLYVTNTSDFDGEWSKSVVQLSYDSLEKVIDYLQWIDIEKTLTTKCGGENHLKEHL